jgi:hypothetical protein
MDLEVILKELREELIHVNMSILALERLAAGEHRGRGRPPKWITDARSEPTQSGHRTVTKPAAAKGE